jgi:hypothetical protein
MAFESPKMAEHSLQTAPSTEMALVALKASLKQKHLQMASNGSETCSNGSRRSKRPKIDPKNVQNGLPVARVMAKTNSPPLLPQKLHKNWLSWS